MIKIKIMIILYKIKLNKLYLNMIFEWSDFSSGALFLIDVFKNKKIIILLTNLYRD